MKRISTIYSGKLIKIKLRNLVESIYGSYYVNYYFIEVINSLNKNMIFLLKIILSKLYHKK